MALRLCHLGQGKAKLLNLATRPFSLSSTSFPTLTNQAYDHSPPVARNALPLSSNSKLCIERETRILAAKPQSGLNLFFSSLLQSSESRSPGGRKGSLRVPKLCCLPGQVPPSLEGQGPHRSVPHLTSGSRLQGCHQRSRLYALRLSKG